MQLIVVATRYAPTPVEALPKRIATGRSGHHGSALALDRATGRASPPAPASTGTALPACGERLRAARRKGYKLALMWADLNYDEARSQAGVPFWNDPVPCQNSTGRWATVVRANGRN